jgi:hypothetical protein
MYNCDEDLFSPSNMIAITNMLCDLPTPCKMTNDIFFIREENLLQMVLWKTVHFALFLVKISINFSPGYSTVFFSITVYVSTLQ